MMPAITFVALNMADAYLTKMSLMAGAIEVNPLMASLGSSIITKGLIAAVLVGALYFLGKERILWLLNLGLLSIVLWNAATYLIVDLQPLHSFIGTCAGF
jgi:hypothetical protein